MIMVIDAVTSLHMIQAINMNKDRKEKIRQLERNIAAAEDLVNDGMRIPIGNITKMYNQLTRLQNEYEESQKELADAGY